MNPDIKQAWLDALRSGEYEQAYGKLRSGNSFCCLGVLCDLHAKATDNVWDEAERYFNEPGALPPEVRDWADLPDTNPDMPTPPDVIGKFTLAEYNDGKRDIGVRPHTFTEIADLIERYL